MTTPAQEKGIIVNVTRLKLKEETYRDSGLQGYVWLLAEDDHSLCPFFNSECGSEVDRCFNLEHMEIIKEQPQRAVLGQFTPKTGNLNAAFSVVSKEPATTAGAYKGEKVSGEEYHVYSEYWDWVPAVPMAAPAPVPMPPVVTMQEALAAPLPVDANAPAYTELQKQAIATFQTMYDHAVMYRNGDSNRLNSSYGICDNIDRFADMAGARVGQMIEVKENLIRTTPIYSGDYTYPVPCPDGGSASNAFSNVSNKWNGAYGLNRLTQLGQLVDIIKSDKWSDDLVNRQTPAKRNGLVVGDVVRYTRSTEPSFWVFRRDDESASPSFHKLTDKDDYTDIDLNHIVKVDKDEICKPRPVSEFLSELQAQADKKADIERQIAELQKALQGVKGDIAMLDYGLADQHKVKRIA